MAAGYGNFPALYFDFRGTGLSPQVYVRREDSSVSGGTPTGGSNFPIASNNQQQGNSNPPNTGQGPEGVLFPVAPEAPPFAPIFFNPIPDINVPFVNSIDKTREVGAFNTEQWKNALTLGSQAARDITQTDFDTLAQFFPQASALQAQGVRAENAINRSEIIPSNAFNLEEIRKANIENQRQRLSQLESALPGARDILMQQLERGSVMAGGRLVSDAEDRAFDVAARNAAAEGANIRGFGDDSVIGRKTSDLLSAQQRLEIQQSGENTLSRFLQLGANLAFDQPIKYNPILNEPLTVRTSQDIRGVPSISGAQLATQQQSAIAQLSTINPAQAIQFEIGQNQFQAGLDREADKFNSTMDLNAQQFNSTGAYQAALEQFYADVFNAQQASAAYNAGNAIDQAKDAFSGSSVLGGITSGLGAIGGAISGISGIASLFRGGSSAAGAGGAAAQGAGVIDNAVNAIGASGATGVVSAPQVFGTPAAAEAAGFQVVGSATNGGVLATPGTSFAGGVTGSAGSTGAALTFANEGAAQAAGYQAIGTASDGGVIATPTQGLAAAGSPLLTAAGVIAGAYTGYQQITGLQQALQNKPLSWQQQAALALPTFGASLVYNPIREFFDSGKSERQQQRDSYREYGAEIGLFFKPSDEQAGQLGLDAGSYYTQLADGSYYNVGTDGGAKLPNYGVNIDKQTERSTYDIDWSDPRVNESVSMLNPVGLMIFGEEYQNMMGHMWNAAASNTDTLSGMKQNIQKFAADAGVDYETGIKLLNQYKDAGKINDNDFAIFMNSWNELNLQTGVPYDIKV